MLAIATFKSSNILILHRFLRFFCDEFDMSDIFHKVVSIKAA